MPRQASVVYERGVLRMPYDGIRHSISPFISITHDCGLRWHVLSMIPRGDYAVE